MPLSLEEQASRRKIALEFIESNQYESTDIDLFLAKHFSHEYKNRNGRFIASHIVKEHFENNRKFSPSGSKSSLTLEHYEELNLTNKVKGIGYNGSDWTDKYNQTTGDYWEIRPCHAKNQMCIIDIDGWKESGDINLKQLFELDSLPGCLRKCPFFLSRTKSLPHFIFRIVGMPENVKIGQYINVLDGFNGDILFNHAWIQAL